MRPSRPADLALELAGEHEWRVLPCYGKRSGLPDWTIAASSNHETIEEHFRQAPGADRVGIATGAGSGLTVLDVDDAPAFMGFCDQHGITLAETWTVTTPSGGRHLYHQHRAGIRNRVKAIPGLDVRNDGGYVLAPGNPGYAWAPGLNPHNADLAPFPEALVPFLTAKATPDHAPVEGVPEGKRNDTLTRLAGAMRRQGATEPVILAALRKANSTYRPPLDDDEVSRVASSVGRYAPAAAAVANETYLTDLGNAERFVGVYGGRVRYCAAQLTWYVWDGCRWRRDDLQEVIRLAAASARAIWKEAAEAATLEDRERLAGWAKSSESRARIEGAVALASSSEAVAIRPDDLDRDPMLLATPSGTVELTIGKLRPADPRDLCTKLTGCAYDPTATAPTWERVLEEILPDPEVRSWLWRLCGYCLTGSVVEQILAFLHGSGLNGKSLVVETLTHVFGEYAAPAPEGLLTATQGERHPAELVVLRGLRLAIASETEENRRWAEARVKTLTGGDAISARGMRENFASFAPTHKLVVVGNHRPVVRGNDLGIWRRLRLVPFTVTIPEDKIDKHLPEKLRAEGPGILRWLVEGCLAWQRDGLQPPAAVVEATGAYRSEMDTVGIFLADCYVVTRSSSHKVANAEIRARYEQWCKDTGERPLSARALALRLQDHGVQAYRTKYGRGWLGLAAARVTDGDAYDPVSGISDDSFSHGSLTGKTLSSVTKRHPDPDDDPDDLDPDDDKVPF